MKPQESLLRRQRRWQVLADVLDAEPGKRRACLAAACGEEATLRREVEELLALESAAEDFLPAPAVDVRGESLEEAVGLAPGTRVGPYRITDLLGRGGMGTVYRALRQDDFEKPVALKVVQREVASPAVLARFHRERQILARLDHPNIARLLDGGTLEDGRPYLVLELVEGVPIDRYCQSHDLGPRQVFELLLPVLSALAFAHQNLVVHRDLKPGNVLVTADGVPKLLDFGIAKLLAPQDETAEDHCQPTLPTERLMTPRYASPEQVRGEPVTAASDLYSLGVLLYQLLTGALPCGLDTCTLPEVARRIAESEPLRPSTRMGAGRPARPLRGDVDAIVLKALRKEPRHRYTSAEQLAEDLRRYLDGRPVAARQGSWLYRGGKFLRRNRWRLAAAALALTALLAFGIREHQRQAAEQARSRQIVAVLRGLLNLADPDRRGEDTVVAVLEDTRRQLAAVRADPGLRAELLGSLGRIHHKLGDLEAARQVLDESLEIWRRDRAGDQAGLAQRLNNLGALYLEAGEYTTAEELLRQALDLRQVAEGEPEVGTPEHRVVNLNNLATVRLYRGDFEEAEALYRQGLSIRERELGRDDPRTSYSLRSLAAVLYNRGEMAEAETLLREVLTSRHQAYGSEHTALAPALDLLAKVRLARGDRQEARALFEQARDVRHQRLGPEHMDLAQSERNLAEVALAEGDLVAARSLIEAALKRFAALPPDHWRRADAESLLGEVLTAEGRRAEAAPLLAASHRTLLTHRGEHALVTQEARRRLEAAAGG